MDAFPFEVFWYCIIIIALIGFAVLDGFDLGVGMVHLFVKKDQERRIFLNAIGPVWDGNAVWLIILTGGLLAGFPGAFATMFSSFYDLMMILLAGIIFRAVAIEFRSKRESKLWRGTWDFLFFLASLTIAFFIGLLLGNLVTGIALDSDHNFIGNFKDFFSLYAICIALTTVCCFMTHGAIYLVLKTEGDLHDRLRKYVKVLLAFYLLFFVLTTIGTLISMPHMIENLYHYPWLFVLPVLTLLFILNVPREMKKGRDGIAFLFSCLSVTAFLTTFGVGMYPNLVLSSLDLINNSVTIFNAAASAFTIFVLLIIVIIGVPLVLVYSIWIYRIFRERVHIDDMSY